MTPANNSNKEFRPGKVRMAALAKGASFKEADDFAAELTQEAQERGFKIVGE